MFTNTFIKETLSSEFLSHGIPFSDNQFIQLQDYVDHLLQWNQQINLISRKDEDNVWTNHIFLSVAFAFFIDEKNDKKIVDIGTGGGLPGIPLAIIFPQSEFLLIDSIQKKTKAVSGIVNSIGLKNATVLRGRAEEISTQKEYFQSTDVVAARSVSELAILLQWGIPFLKKRAHERIPRLLALKGCDTEEEYLTAKQKYPSYSFHRQPLNFRFMEQLANRDKQMVVVER